VIAQRAEAISCKLLNHECERMLGRLLHDFKPQASCIKDADAIPVDLLETFHRIKLQKTVEVLVVSDIVSEPALIKPSSDRS
jgi:hypothetical protein